MSVVAGERPAAAGMEALSRTPGEFVLLREEEPADLSPWSTRRHRLVTSRVLRLHPTLQAQADARRASRRRPVTGPRILPEA